MSDALLTKLESNGVLWVTPADIGSMQDIDRRIKDGDESGWRGDPSMGLFLNHHKGTFEVWGIDRAGREYLAASHDKLDITLIHKLRDGDPRKHDVINEVLAHNAKLQADRDQKDRDHLAQIADKMQWAIKQDFGQHLGGSGRKTSMYRKGQ